MSAHHSVLTGWNSVGGYLSTAIEQNSGHEQGRKQIAPAVTDKRKRETLGGQKPGYHEQVKYDMQTEDSGDAESEILTE